MLSKITRIVSALLATILLAIVLVGCGGENEPADLTPAQVIEKSAPAMQEATSFHFDLETSALDKPMPGIFINKASGDVAKPDKLAADVTASFMGIPVNIKAVVDGDKQFMTDPTSGVWQSTALAIDVKQYFNPGKGVADILGNVQGLQSDGKESVDNTETYRLTGTVPAAALQALSPEVTAQSNLTTTLWIDTTDYLLRRVLLQGQIDANEPQGIERTINFSAYNKPVTIETPVVK